MSRSRRGWAASLALAGALGTPRAPAAQLSATLDAGVSRVEYDGFLPSAAVSLTPSLRFDHHDWSVTARGTFLHFESGNHSLQGLVAASAFTPPAGALRGEIGATGGTSSYRDFPSFGHLLARARLHWLSLDQGGWVGASAGQTSFGAGPRLVTVVSAGGWKRLATMIVDVSAAHTAVGDTTFTDLEAAGRWASGVVEISASLGARLWSRGAGDGVYGEANATLPFHPRLAFVFGAGRYPTDPTRGSVAGRYFSAGLRMTGLSAPLTAHVRSRAASQLFRRADESAAIATVGTNGHFAAASVEIRRHRDASSTIVIRAAWAQAVEIMGDFTDWQPVALERTAAGTWRTTLRIPTGIHRLNVRLDGGDWSVPRGATMIEDDFGGRVGTIVVP